MEKRRPLASSSSRSITVMMRVACACLLLLVFGLSTQPTWAAPTTSAQAEQAVQAYLALNAKPMGAAMAQTVAGVTTYLGTNQQPLYYVVALKPTGFFVVSADNLIEPIVAFSKSGIYNPSTLSPLVALVKGDLQARMSTAQAQEKRVLPKQPAPASQAELKWQSLLQRAQTKYLLPTEMSDVRVAPLLQTTWSQSTTDDAMYSPACYNYYTPSAFSGLFNSFGYSTNDVCGCVATAMAQVMYYWQYPTQPVGTPSFLVSTENENLNYFTIPQPLRGGNGSGGAYQWSLMPRSPSATAASSWTPNNPGLEQIGDLCHDTGASVRMMYSAGESGSYVDDACTALKNTFGFQDAVVTTSGADWTSNYTDGMLLNEINASLNAQRPVILGIQDLDEGGHCVVCDGYGYDPMDTLYHHLNMGWSGVDDIWYDLPIIDTAVDGYLPTIVDYCVFNISPYDQGEIISGRVATQSGMPVVGGQVTVTTANGTQIGAVTTNADGIYAFSGLPSNATYTVATLDGKNIVKKTFTIGASISALGSAGVDTTSGSCADVWNADFIVAKTFAINTSTPVTPVSAGNSYAWFLPSASVNSPFTYTFPTLGGTAPISWLASPSGYAETSSTATLAYPAESAQWYQSVTPAGPAMLPVLLPFNFPYFGQTFTQIYVSGNGYINLLNGQPAASATLGNFKSSCGIFPLWRSNCIPQSFSVSPYTDANVNAVRVTWSAKSPATNQICAFQVMLYDTGEIDFYYQNVDPGSNANDIVGFSNGDGVNYTLSSYAPLAMANSGSLDWQVPSQYVESSSWQDVESNLTSFMTPIMTEDMNQNPAWFFNLLPQSIVHMLAQLQQQFILQNPAATVPTLQQLMIQYQSQVIAMMLSQPDLITALQTYNQLFSWSQTGGTVGLPFNFPFYGNTYSQINISLNGYISLTNAAPGLSPTVANLKSCCGIFPLWGAYYTNPLVNVMSYSNGNVNEECITWSALSEFNNMIFFQVILHDTGEIDYSYWGVDPDTSMNAIVGISNGDGVNYSISAYAPYAMEWYSSVVWTANQVDNLTSHGLTLDPQAGTITGTPTVAGDFPVWIQATDSSNPSLIDNEFFRLLIAPPVVPNQTLVVDENNGTAPAPSLTVNLGIPSNLNFSISSVVNNGSWMSLGGDTYQYTPNVNFVGTETISYTVTDANSNVVATPTYTINVIPQPLGVTLATSPTSSSVANSPVTLTASTTGGNGSTVLYAFLVNGNTVEDFSATNSYVWTPPASPTTMNYTLQVQAKNTNGGIVAQSALMTYVVTPAAPTTPPLTAVTLNPVAAPQYIGTPITLTAQATGGANVQYEFLVNGTAVTGYTASNSYVWTPILGGSDKITVLARDLNSATPNLAITSPVLSVMISTKGLILTVPQTSPQPVKTKVTLAASAPGFTKPLYRFQVGSTDIWGRVTWTSLPNATYSTTNTVTWQPAAAGTYTLMVWVRESTSTQAYDLSQSQTYVVTAH